MVRRDVISLSGTNKWVPFFEESSEKRDTESWWRLISREVDKYGLQVKSLVSDRARALIKLGSSKYLNVLSMPDLFHFSQDLSKTIGFQIGKKREQARKALALTGDSCKENVQSVFEHIDEIRQSYRQQIEQINKTVHPLNEEDQWTDEAAVEKGLLHCLTSIGRLTKQLDIEPEVKKTQKI